MFIGPCIIVIVEEWKTNLMSLAILFHFLCVICGIRVAGWSCASACNTDTTPTQPHRNSITHRTKNNTTNVVIQQNSRELLMMDILMPETCWTHKNWNKVASDIKLVFYSSTLVMLIIFTSLHFFHWKGVQDFRDFCKNEFPPRQSS